MDANTKTQSIKILIPVIAILALAAGIVTFSFPKGGKKSLEEYLDLGAKYLQEQDYKNAIAAFTEALKIDDMSVDAYLGMADAYVGKGEVEKAIEILETGYEKTGDERIQAKLDELKNNSTASSNQERIPLTDRGRELAELFLSSDGITVNGKYYTALDFHEMTPERATSELGLHVLEERDEDGHLTYNNFHYESDYVASSEDSSIVISKENWGNVLEFRPVEEGSGSQAMYWPSLSDTGNSHYYISYAPQERIPYECNANALFEYLDANGLNSIDRMIAYFIGREPEGNESITVIPDAKICIISKDDVKNIWIQEIDDTGYTYLSISIQEDTDKKISMNANYMDAQ